MHIDMNWLKKCYLMLLVLFNHEVVATLWWSVDMKSVQSVIESF